MNNTQTAAEETFRFPNNLTFDLDISVSTVYTSAFLVTGFTKEGPFSYSITPTGNGSPEHFYRSLSDIPLAISIIDPNESFYHGNIWIECYLRVNKTPTLKLCSGNVSQLRGLSYPTSSGNAPAMERVFPFTGTFSNPAAGANLSLNPGTYNTWKVHSLAFRFITDANVANRRVHVRLQTSGNTKFMDFFPSIDQPANTTIDYVAQTVGAVPDETDSNITVIPIPNDLYVVKTSKLVTSITNIQAGDQISNVVIFCEEYGADL